MVEEIAKMSMPAEMSQLLLLIRGRSYYRKLLSNLSNRLGPITDLMKTHSSLQFPSDVRSQVRNFLQELSKPAASHSLHRTHRPTAFGHFSSTLMPAAIGLVLRSNRSSKVARFAPSQSLDELVHLMSVDRPFSNSRLTGPCGRSSVSSVFIFDSLRYFTEYRASKNLDTIGKHHPRLQRWIELLDAYQSTLQYRRGTGES